MTTELLSPLIDSVQRSISDMPHPADRPKIDRARAKADPELASLTNAELDAALEAVDQGAVYAEQRSAWSVEVWDRTSPINGVPAQHFLDRDDVDENGDDDIYLLIQDGQVVGFQPHEPETEGLERIPQGEGETRGAKYADTLAADAADNEVLRLVREHAAAKGPKKQGRKKP